MSYKTFLQVYLEKTAEMEEYNNLEEILDYYDLDFVRLPNMKTFDIFGKTMNQNTLANTLHNHFQWNYKTDVYSDDKEPIMVSTFAKKSIEVLSVKITDSDVTNGLSYESVRRNRVSDAIIVDRLLITQMVIGLTSSYEELTNLYNNHGVNLCFNFQKYICSVVIKDNIIYYRPIGTEYYIVVKEKFKNILQPRPVLQVLNSMVNIYEDTNNHELYAMCNRQAILRWENANIDGYFLLTSCPLPHLPTSHTLRVLTYYEGEI